MNTAVCAFVDLVRLAREHTVALDEFDLQMVQRIRMWCWSSAMFASCEK